MSAPEEKDPALAEIELAVTAEGVRKDLTRERKERQASEADPDRAVKDLTR